MRGETITIYSYVATGRDDMGDTIKEWVSETLDNVLIAPVEPSDIADAVNPERVKAAYELCLPKTFVGDLQGAKVVLPREEKPFWVEGRAEYFPDNGLTPTSWHSKVRVYRVEG